MNKIENFEIFDKCWYYYLPSFEASLKVVTQDEFDHVSERKTSLHRSFQALMNKKDFLGAISLLMGFNNPAPVAFLLLCHLKKRAISA